MSSNRRQVLCPTHAHMHIQTAPHLHLLLVLLTTQPSMHQLMVSLICMCMLLTDTIIAQSHSEF